MLSLPLLGLGQITDSLEIKNSDQFADSLMIGDSIPEVNEKEVNLKELSISKDSLSAKVDYGAQDSLDFNNGMKVVHLYGEAYVTYEDLKLTADYIRINFEENIAYAEGRPDSSGQIAGLPHLVQAGQEFDAQKITYNFNTKKGFITEIRTQYNNTYILGTKTKYVSAESDTTGNTEEDYINFKSAIFTTCDHPEPHFGVRSSKIKVVPNKVVVVGPSQIEIAGVPTPLVLPFAFFPLKQGKRTGLIFPRDYEYSPAWGFGLNNIGWYFPISEYVDLIATADIYTRGRWGINLNSRYRKRYKYSGSFEFNYSNRKTEAIDDYRKNSEKSYQLRLRHTQDANAHPYKTLGGSLNLTFNNFDQINRNDAASVLNNTLSSNFTYSQTFPGKPYSLSMGLTHSQNTRSRNISISFPNLDFRVRQISPFKRKNGATGKERWYEKINLQYNFSLRNKWEGIDTTFFTQETLDNAQFGIRQNVTTNANFRVLKYFNLTPSVQYSEVWYWNTIRRDFSEELEITVVDSIIDLDGNVTFIQDTLFGQASNENRFVKGFEPFRTVTASLSMNTQIFGTMQFKKGWLKGIRHVIKPTVSLNFAPDYLSEQLGYYLQQDSDIRAEFNNPTTYSIFQGGIFGSPPRTGRQGAISYSVSNIFEAKYFSKKDSTDKKFKIFDNIYVNGNYNLAADSLKWSPVSISGTTRLFKGATTLSFNMMYDPYVLNENSQRINTTVKSENGKLIRFAGGQIRIATRLTGQRIKEIFSKSSTEKKSRPSSSQQSDQFVDLFNGFSINHNIVLTRMVNAMRDTSFIQTNSISMRGRLKLTKNWNINIGNIGYDFNSKRLTYPDIGFYRDLHCWEAGMDWQPQRGTYSFYIRVKPGTLDFLKLPYRKNNADAVRGF